MIHHFYKQLIIRLLLFAAALLSDPASKGPHSELIFADNTLTNLKQLFGGTYSEKSLFGNIVKRPEEKLVIVKIVFVLLKVILRSN